MNEQKLKQAQADFLLRYPGGFLHPEMQLLAKKHRGEKMTALTQELFAKNNFKNPSVVTENMITVVNRSSMISLFEKPKFRDFIRCLDGGEKEEVAIALKQLLYGKQQQGFERLLSMYTRFKLGKWSLLTIIPNYMAPQDEVFVKPTTTKGVIRYFELDGLVYSPKPSWEFYVAYRAAILDMRSRVQKNIAPSNAAFSGFLMLTMG